MKAKPQTRMRKPRKKHNGAKIVKALRAAKWAAFARNGGFTPFALQHPFLGGQS